MTDRDGDGLACPLFEVPGLVARQATGKELEGRSLATQEGCDPTRLVNIGEFEGDGHLRVLVRKASDISPESGQRALQRPKHLRTYLGRLAGLV